MHHASDEFNCVADFEWDVDGIQFLRRKGSVMNVRRQGMTYGIADYPEDLSIAIYAIYPVKIAQLRSLQLAGRCAAFVIE
jgi:hypothetical protein